MCGCTKLQPFGRTYRQRTRRSVVRGEALVKEGKVLKHVSLLGALAVCALALSALSAAATRTTVWTAALSSGQEVPPQVVKDAAAHGLFKGTLSGSKLSWKLTFAKLT